MLGPDQQHQRASSDECGIQSAALAMCECACSCQSIALCLCRLRLQGWASAVREAAPQQASTEDAAEEQQNPDSSRHADSAETDTSRGAVESQSTRRRRQGGFRDVDDGGSLPSTSAAASKQNSCRVHKGFAWPFRMSHRCMPRKACQMSSAPQAARQRHVTCFTASTNVHFR